MNKHEPVKNLAIKTCKWFEPGSTKTVNGLQGGARRGFGDRNEFNLKGAAALVTKCAGMGQQGVGVGGSTGVGAGGGTRKIGIGSCFPNTKPIRRTLTKFFLVRLALHLDTWM